MLIYSTFLGIYSIPRLVSIKNLKEVISSNFAGVQMRESVSEGEIEIERVCVCEW